MSIKNTKKTIKSFYINSIVNYRNGKISFQKLEEIYSDMFEKWYEYKRENEYTLLDANLNLKSVNMEDFDLIDPNDIR